MNGRMGVRGTLGERDCEASKAAWASVPEAKTADTRATERKRVEHGVRGDSKAACPNSKPAGAPSV